MEVTFSRTYTVTEEELENRFKSNFDITNRIQCRDQAVIIATEKFDSEFEFLDASSDNFSTETTQNKYVW